MKPAAIPALLAAACLLGACSQLEIRHDTYPDGSPKNQTAFLIRDDRAHIKHGIQMAWYPDGGKESMDIYVHGYRQGYAFRWHPNGRLMALEHFTDGVRDREARFWDGDGKLAACFTTDGSECLRPSAEEPDPSALASRP